MIVRDPVDCKECDTTFCRLCAEGIIKLQQSCPIRCSEGKIFEYKNVNRRVKAMLIESRYECNDEKCN